MITKTIKVRAGRCFNHPHEQYSNLQPSVEIEATLDDGEDSAAAAKLLQQRAEQLVEDHKNNLLRSIEELYQLTEQQAEMRGLQKQLKSAQDRIDEIRKAHPDFKLISEETEKGDDVPFE